MFEFTYKGTEIEYRIFMAALKANLPQVNIRLSFRKEDSETEGMWAYKMEILNATKDDIFRVGMMTATCCLQSLIK